jgi:hypothetical protein
MEHTTPTRSVPCTLFGSRPYMKQIDDFKSNFGWWESWTTARWARERNPNPHDKTDLDAVCRFDAQTQCWVKVS